MAIQINGNGTITGISVGGLPDGIVDTDMIANSAVTTAKSSGLGTSTRTVGSAITLSNQSNVDFTGFGTIKRFDIMLNAVSCSNSTNWGIKIGTGGSVDSSGYRVQCGYLLSNSNIADANSGGFFTKGLADSNYSNNGIFRFVNVHHQTGSKWYCDAIITEYSTTNYTFYVKGYRTLSGALDIIRVLPIAGTFDSGELRLVTYSD